MARNRMIKPEFWEDSKIATLSDKAKLLFIALWNFADDEGFLENNSKWISIKCFPYEKDLEIEKFLAELLKIEVICIKNDVICIKNFLKHQKIKKAISSKLKEKFEDSKKSGEPVGKEWGTSGEPVLTPFFKEKLKEKEKEVKGKESVKGKPNGENPEPPFFNSPETTGTANSNNQTATTTAETAETAEKAKMAGQDKSIMPIKSTETGFFKEKNNLSVVKKQNDKKTEKNGKETVLAIPKGFKQLVNFLINQYGYPPDKAKLIANRVQSDNYQLTLTHCKSFKDVPDEDIIKIFDLNLMAKKICKEKTFNKVGIF